MSRTLLLIIKWYIIFRIGVAGFGEDPEDPKLNRPESIATVTQAQNRRTDTVEPQIGLGPSEQKMFDWFDSLGFPKLTDRKFVRVAVAGVPIDKHPFALKGQGILINEDRDTMTIMTLDLGLRTILNDATSASRFREYGKVSPIRDCGNRC
jgi:hypothetical protein